MILGARIDKVAAIVGIASVLSGIWDSHVRRQADKDQRSKDTKIKELEKKLEEKNKELEKMKEAHSPCPSHSSR